VNYAKLLEMNCFLLGNVFLEVGKTQDLSSKICQTLGDALNYVKLLDMDFVLLLVSF
jgi:hypothetical protein